MGFMSDLQKLTDFLNARFNGWTEFYNDPVDFTIHILGKTAEQFEAPPPTVQAEKLFIFSTTCAYNKGLGVQTMELGDVVAASVPAAEEQAKKLADSKVGQDKWMEVKVRPTGIYGGVIKSPDNNV
jgi:hypothetical protein